LVAKIDTRPCRNPDKNRILHYGLGLACDAKPQANLFGYEHIFVLFGLNLL
jgi:hypothetical protein